MLTTFTWSGMETQAIGKAFTVINWLGKAIGKVFVARKNVVDTQNTLIYPDMEWHGNAS